MQSDQVSRFIKKVEKTEDFMDSVLISSTLSEEKVKQNVALEIYEDYFNTEDPATNSEEFNVKTIISYPDPSKKIENQNRPVSFQTYTNIIKSFEFSFHILNFLCFISDKLCKESSKLEYIPIYMSTTLDIKKGNLRLTFSLSFSPGSGDSIAISYCSEDFLEAVTWPYSTSGYIFDIRKEKKHIFIKI